MSKDNFSSQALSHYLEDLFKTNKNDLNRNGKKIKSMLQFSNLSFSCLCWRSINQPTLEKLPILQQINEVDHLLLHLPPSSTQMSDHLVRRKQNKKLSQTFLHDMSPAALSFSEEWIFIFTGRDRKEGNPCQKEIVFRPTFTKAGIPAWRWAYFIRPAIKAHSSVDFVSSPAFGWIWLAWILGRPTISSSIEIIVFLGKS